MLAHRSLLSMKALKTTFAYLSETKQICACVSEHLQRCNYWSQIEYSPL